jgi:hypothetical protein
MSQVVQPFLKLYEAQFNDKEFTSSNHLSKALLTQSEWLAPMVTHAYGSSANFGGRNFPLSFLTEGMGAVKKISSTDLSYKMAVMGRPKKTSTVAISSVGSQLGRGRTKFTVTFADRWFYKSQSVYSPSRIECRVQSVPKASASGNGWEYSLQLMNPDPNAFIPASDVLAGAVWGGGVAKVGKERSRGVESRSYTPFQTQNQITVTRATYNIAGNIKNKVMVLEIRANGKTFKFWTQFEMFLKQLEYKEQLEHDLWHSEYNKDLDGVIHLTDEDSGEVVPSGAGVLQQIPNQDSFSILTTKKISTLVRDIFFNASDADKVDVEIFTGTGGLEDADNAMKNASNQFTLVDTKIVQGQAPGKLSFGAYFNVYRHVDGHTVTFRKLPLMDKGIMAEISARHPLSDLPLESHNMYCLDMSTYDGMKNIQYVSEAGREEINKVVAGMSGSPDGYTESLFASSDIDASSVEWLKTHGIAIMRATNCFKVYNTFGQ